MTNLRNAALTRFLAKYHGRKVHYFSLTSLQLEAYYNEVSLGKSTCFLVDDQNEISIFSNWHVFSGRCTICGHTLNRNGGIPNRLRIWMHSNPTDSDAGSPDNYVVLDVPLHDDSGSPLWKQHPRGQLIDVACIGLSVRPSNASLVPLNATNATAVSGDLSIGNEVFVVGFPGYIPLTFGLPIWKRGSIASETVEIDGKIEKFLIDAATRQGMSGSPVFAHRRTGYDIVGSEASIVDGMYIPIGIYSGRVSTSDALGSELGFVWPIGMVDEILRNGVLGGSFELIPESDRKCPH